MHRVSGIPDYDTHMRSSNVVVAQFSAPWCGPCKKITPVADNLAAQHTSLKFLLVDCEANKDLGMREGIKSFPTYYFFVKGKKQEELTFSGADVTKLKQTVEMLSQKHCVFAGTGHSLSNSTGSSSGGSRPKRRNPWADPNFGAKMMGTKEAAKRVVEEQNQSVAVKKPKQVAVLSKPEPVRPKFEPEPELEQYPVPEVVVEPSAPAAPSSSSLQWPEQVAQLQMLVGESRSCTDEYLDNLLDMVGGDINAASSMLF